MQSMEPEKLRCDHPMRASLGNLHQFRGFLVHTLEIVQQMKCVLELLEIVIRPQGADASAFHVRLLDSTGGRERQRGNCMCVNMSVGLLSDANGKIGGLL